MSAVRISSRRRRQLRLFAFVIGLGVFAGLLVSSLQSILYGSDEFIWPYLLNGAIDGGLSALLIGSYVIFLAEGELRPHMRRMNVALAFLINAVVFLALLILARAIGRYISGEYDRIILFPLHTEEDAGYFYNSILVAFSICLVVNAFLQLSGLIGGTVLLQFLTGRYNTPRREQRFVVFVDLKSSTSITEKIGDAAYMHLLDEFFHDVSEAALETRATIYKYVGDEVILTWTMEPGCQRENCLRFYSMLRESITRREPIYRKRFEVAPDFRAALHAGEVLSGELGDTKREIAFIGDVFNTVARVMDIGRKVGRDFLVSGTALERLGLTGDQRFERLGAQRLRGKTHKIEVFSVTRP